MRARRRTPAAEVLELLGRRLRSALARSKSEQPDRCSRKGCRGCPRHGRCDGDGPSGKEDNAR